VGATLRPADAGDAEHIKWALYHALAWNAEQEGLLRQVTLEHPEVARYHREWGRRGDGGVIASVNGNVVGVAFFRLFTADDHGHGFVDDKTPEIAIAVHPDWRGRGLGTRLMHELVTVARTAKFTQLSLSVDADNPARRLYERLGYRELTVDDSGVRMLYAIDRVAA